MHNKKRISYYLNMLISGLSALSIAWMISGLNLEKNSITFSEKSLGGFKYFTVDSNAFMGLAAFIMFLYEGRVLKGKRKDIPYIVKAIYLMGVTSVAVTMLITTCYLAPKSSEGYFSLFKNTNFLMHFLTPLLSIITMVVFEKHFDITYKSASLGTVPVVIYGIIYLIDAMKHIEGNKIAKGHDWYDFLAAGINTVYFVFPLIILSSYVMSFILSRS